jgi:hypothetical protein
MKNLGLETLIQSASHCPRYFISLRLPERHLMRAFRCVWGRLPDARLLPNCKVHSWDFTHVKRVHIYRIYRHIVFHQLSVTEKAHDSDVTCNCYFQIFRDDPDISFCHSGQLSIISKDLPPLDSHSLFLTTPGHNVSVPV